MYSQITQLNIFLEVLCCAHTSLTLDKESENKRLSFSTLMALQPEQFIPLPEIIENCRVSGCTHFGEQAASFLIHRNFIK